MAYNGNVTIDQRVGANGRKNWSIRIDQNEDSGTSEVIIEGLPPRGRILRFRCQHNSGTAANFEPELGRTTGWTKASMDTVMLIESVAVGLVDEEKTPFTYFSNPAGTEYIDMYFRTNCDAGSDNDITTEFIIEEL